MISTIKHQANELMTELKRVDWPGKQKVLRSSYQVTIVSVFVGAYLWASDQVITWVVSFIIPRH